jgi:threonine aldolase
MIRFECDYSEGAHPEILDALIKTNFEQTKGYGNDEHCEKARRLIRQLCGDNTIDVHFLTGGTQTNTTVISSVLRPHQGVLSAETGHISIHETGAIESIGHKVLEIKGNNGKISADQIKDAYESHHKDENHEHIVQPGMVYISNPTETGTIYTKKELENISEVCRKNNIPLFLDGARLGYALASEANDLTLADIARLTDVFYIGGTKIGALFGEAVVISNDKIKKDFRYIIKQRGGMLAKGRILGIQFEVLFKDGLYFEISRHAVQMAMMIKKAFEEKNISFLNDSPTNQQFPILTKEQIDILTKKYAFEKWLKIDESKTAVRFCTSWATEEKNIQALINDIASL